MNTETATWSIGDLAEATDIAPATIRVWERRYGRPVPERLPSGHRRYRDRDVTWLRRVGEAIAAGHRPSAVISLSDDALDELLAESAPNGSRDEPASRYLPFILAYRDEELRRALQLEIGLQGPRAFILDIVSPLLTLVGRGWADGELEIRHEHFLTEILEDLLRGIRESIRSADHAKVVLLATLPGEDHGLGLQMAAAFAALSGIRTSILGTDVPLTEIIAASADSGASAVCVSVSLANAGVATDRTLAQLRAGLPAELPLVVGGRGARGPRRGPRDVVYLESLEAFDGWLGRL